MYFNATLFETDDLAGQETDPYAADRDICGKLGERFFTAAPARWNRI